ncbi:MAG TPA: DNA polymerase III subunit beta [Thermodesulfobacteriota bacterium]|jgi:DNA polymerase-3 subunit beta|nr:DNA polymerase III subunit beta [Thermodesulfobacteriota bacterium]
MDFEIDKREFLKGLGLMQSVAGRRTTLPILSHILLEWEKDSLCLTGTDLETGIREELTARIHQGGKASVSAKKIFEIVKELPEETIHIKKKENQWITIQCGKSVFNLAGLDPEEFPSLPTYSDESFSQVSTNLMKEMIEKTVFAASSEESRYHLNGILISQSKKGEREILRMVATDGHRLSLLDRESQMIRGIEKGIIIPKKGVLEIKKIMGDRDGAEEMKVYFDQTHGFFKMGKSLMVIRLIDGEFPEYEQVIPKGNDKRILMEKGKMYASLRRVSTMASERVEGIKFLVKKNFVELSSYHQDFGDAKEEVEVSYEGPSLEIGFNARYLMEALSVMDKEDVVMELKDEGSPGILKPQSVTEPSNQLCIVMPMRI